MSFKTFQRKFDELKIKPYINKPLYIDVRLYFQLLNFMLN